MKMPSRGLAKAVAGAAGAAAASGMAGAWVLQRRRDQRAIEGDPERAELEAPLEGRPVEVVSADGTVLHAEVFGPDEGPTIVLAHGWACSLEVWRYQIRDLAGDYRVVAYDQRGHRHSQPATDGDYSTDALAADLGAVLELCGPDDGKVLFAGHSMGAMALAAWAEAHPEEVEKRLAGAVLTSTGVNGLIREARVIVTAAGLGGLKHAVGSRLLSWPVSLPISSTPLLFRAVRHITLGADATPAQVAFCERMFLDTPPDIRAAFGATFAGLDLLDALQALTVPTVVVVGDRDRVTPPVHADAMVAALPDATLLTLHGAGHMTPIESHSDVTAAIRALAERVLGRPGGRSSAA